MARKTKAQKQQARERMLKQLQQTDSKTQTEGKSHAPKQEISKIVREMSEKDIEQRNILKKELRKITLITAGILSLLTLLSLTQDRWLSLIP